MTAYSGTLWSAPLIRRRSSSWSRLHPSALGFFSPPLISPARTGGDDPKGPTPSPSVASGRRLHSAELQIVLKMVPTQRNELNLGSTASLHYELAAKFKLCVWLRLCALSHVTTCSLGRVGGVVNGSTTTVTTWSWV